MFFLMFLALGFLLAVLWIDLIFDFPAFPHRGKPGPLPEEVLAEMASFYHRITARPFLIFIVMLTILSVLVMELVQGLVPAWAAWLSLGLFLTPVLYAVTKIMPSARRFGKRIDTLEKQSEFAHALLPMHAFSFLMILALAVVQLVVLWEQF